MERVEGRPLLLLVFLPKHQSLIYPVQFIYPFTQTTKTTRTARSCPTPHPNRNHALPNNNHPPPRRGGRVCSSFANQPERQPILHRPPRRLRQINLLRRQRPGRNLLLLDLQTPRGPLRHGFQRPGLGQRVQLRRVCEGLAWREVDHCDGKWKNKNKNPNLERNTRK